MRRLTILAAAVLALVAPVATYAQSPTKKEGFIITSDSARLFYRSIGTAKDTIIAIHGGPGVDLESIYGDFLSLAKLTP